MNKRLTAIIEQPAHRRRIPPIRATMASSWKIIAFYALRLQKHPLNSSNVDDLQRATGWVSALTKLLADQPNKPIPIAYPSVSITVVHPAVSSLEACQTPAH